MKGDTHTQRTKPKSFMIPKHSPHTFNFIFSYLFFLPPEQMKNKKKHFLFLKKGALHEMIWFYSSSTLGSTIQPSRHLKSGTVIISIFDFFFFQKGHLQGSGKANVSRVTDNRRGDRSPSREHNTHGRGLSFERCSSKHDYLFVFSCNAYGNKKSFRDERNDNFKSA